MKPYVETSGDPKPISIVGLVIGILSLFFSLIPCVGSYAMGPALLAFMFSAITFFIFRAREQKSGVSLAGMIVSACAIGVGIYQYVTFREVFKAKEEITREVNEAGKQITEQMLDTLIISSQRVKDTIPPAEDSLNRQ
ncbi:hypothetical protein ACLI09_05975 [Flavobacterium sp. RHBU_24]|uniref:hypothetical protein n=1 Tax=Flavobacterium sp. RHBU_24 TaxID=3391185 RepID=UPI00398500DD